MTPNPTLNESVPGPVLEQGGLVPPGTLNADTCAATEKEPLPPRAKLAELLQLVSLAEDPDPRLDGQLDGLVGHEGEAWPAPYTREVMHLQRITPRLGLSVNDVSADALVEMSAHPWRKVALIYAEAMLRRLIALADASERSEESSPRQVERASSRDEPLLPPTQTTEGETHE